MPTTGDNIGHYRIGAKLGEGGMGEVWRATDTKLNREVAVKVLPAAVAGDALRLARFTREAQVLASLNHPNIAAIYGVEDRALVMELVEGPTLAEKIAAGPMPLDEDLPIARQMAEALAYAHEKGIVHRDLKPANVKVTPDGVVKILDFGLAKAMATESSTGSAASDAATTLSSATTLAGTVLGTAAYMAPEQARGQAVDRRADVWAYGVVLYELLTGERPFGGPTVSDTLAAVLTKDPALEKVPARVRPLLATCLQKNPRERWGCMSDLRRALDAAPGSDSVAPASRRRLILAVAVAAVVSVAATALLTRRFQPTPSSARRTVGRFRYLLPTGQEFNETSRNVLDISPDGSKIVYQGGTGFYIRALDSLDAKPLSGTPLNPYNPVFSPDGRWVAYFIPGSPDVLQKIPVQGGTPVTLCTLKGNVYGASWSNGQIVFGDDGGSISGIESVPDSGGTPKVLATAPQGDLAANPHLVDAGGRLMFDLFNPNQPGTRRVVVQDINAPATRRTLIANGSDARLLSTGELVYSNGLTLYGVRVDPARLTVIGAPAPLLTGVKGSYFFDASQYAVANNGTLVYWPGQSATIERVAPLWVDQHGHETPIPIPAGVYVSPRVSPDGKIIALGGVSGLSGSGGVSGGSIWLWDRGRQTLSRFSFEPGLNLLPAWAPSGQFVYFDNELGRNQFFRKAANGAGQTTLIPAHSGLLNAVTPDGKLAVSVTVSSPHRLQLVPLQPGAAAKPLLTAPGFDLTYPALSPDGHWLAYTSNESGQDEVYVRPFPGVNDGKWQISAVEGALPLWSRDGRTLYFVTHANVGAAPVQGVADMMAVAVRTSPIFSAGRPHALFPLKSYVLALGLSLGIRGFDIAPDGRFFMLKEPAASAGTESLTIVTNWAQNLQSKPAH